MIHLCNNDAETLKINHDPTLVFSRNKRSRRTHPGSVPRARPTIAETGTWNVRRRTAAAGLPGASTPPGDYIGLECSETLTDLRYQSIMNRS